MLYRVKITLEVDMEGYWPWQGTGDQLKQAPADHFSWGVRFFR